MVTLSLTGTDLDGNGGDAGSGCDELRGDDRSGAQILISAVVCPGAEIAVQLEGERMLVRLGAQLFCCLPCQRQTSNSMTGQSEVEFTSLAEDDEGLIEATQFLWRTQDVRHYLTGMLFETGKVKNCAPWHLTASHRLAVCSMPIGQSLPSHSVIAVKA